MRPMDGKSREMPGRKGGDPPAAITTYTAGLL